MKTVVPCSRCGLMRYEDRMESHKCWDGSTMYRCLARGTCKARRREARKAQA